MTRNRTEHPGTVIRMVMDDATAEALHSLLTDRVFQNMIGGEEWSVCEAHEKLLWNLIRALEIRCPDATYNPR